MAKRVFKTKVTRYVLTGGDDHHWVEIGTYTDATVGNGGDGNFLRAPEAYLRAYSSDPNFYGDQDYQDDNCIRVVDDEDVEYYGEEMRGFVIDCDGDIALLRERGVVLSHYSFGDGQDDWVVLVPTDYDLTDSKIERWAVRIA